MEKQEKQAIKITLRSTQRREGDTETVEQSLEGTLTVFENGWRVAYREETEAGMGKTDTALTVTEGRVVLDRHGETACRMVFRVGRRTLTEYRTLYGRFPVELFTHEAESVLREEAEGWSGQLDLRYALSLGGGEAGETDLTLCFAPEG